MRLDTDARYAESHEWARKEGELIVVGISDLAQEQLSDVVYVELPTVGAVLAKGETFGVVESVKAASDLYMPMGGAIAAINETLATAPELINKSPYGDGWLVKVKADQLAEWEDLLSPEAYAQANAGA